MRIRDLAGRLMAGGAIAFLALGPAEFVGARERREEGGRGAARKDPRVRERANLGWTLSERARQGGTEMVDVIVTLKSKSIAGRTSVASLLGGANARRPQPPATDRPRAARMDPSRLAEQGLVRILSGRDRSKASADVSPVDFISAGVEAALRAELGAEPQLPCAES